MALSLALSYCFIRDKITAYKKNSTLAAHIVIPYLAFDDLSLTEVSPSPTSSINIPSALWPFLSAMKFLQIKYHELRSICRLDRTFSHQSVVIVHQ
jgi:hypothetical protein